MEQITRKEWKEQASCLADAEPGHLVEAKTRKEISLANRSLPEGLKLFKSRWWFWYWVYPC